MTADQWTECLNLLARVRQKLADEGEAEFASDVRDFEARAQVQLRERRAAEEHRTTEN